MIFRPFFFDSVRASLFGGKLTQPQVDGMELLLAYPCGDDRQRAYVLATAFHETGRKMQPVREIGKGRGKKYGIPDSVTKQTYYGRGFVQLTWKSNYEKMGEALRLNLVLDPDAALVPAHACAILYEGMERGRFTGRTLYDFINHATTDYVNARRIVNGLDKAKEIAAYAVKFHTALSHTEDV